MASLLRANGISSFFSDSTKLPKGFYPKLVSVKPITSKSQLPRPFKVRADVAFNSRTLTPYPSSSSGFGKPEMEKTKPKSEPTLVKLKPIEATPESFKEYGQVIESSPDGEEFGPNNAQLDLSKGIPRFYIMRLQDRPLKFSKITHHASVTQCLGSIGADVWYLGIAKPSIMDSKEYKRDDGRIPVQSHCGHFYVPPSVDDIRVFRIAGSKFLKLNRGTWHAGPLFKADAMDFYNLELSNTNVVDHTTHDFVEENGVIFLIDE